MCYNSEQAAHYHNLGLSVGGFTSDQPLDWSQSEELSFFLHHNYVRHYTSSDAYLIYVKLCELSDEYNFT